MYLGQSNIYTHSLPYIMIGSCGRSKNHFNFEEMMSASHLWRIPTVTEMKYKITCHFCGCQGVKTASALVVGCFHSQSKQMPNFG